MSDARPLEGSYAGNGRKFAIVAARFNQFVVEQLVSGARDALRRHGVEDGDVTMVWVPGCFELPVAAKRLAGRTSIDAVIALGAVIRGETAHFDYVAGQCAAGLQQVMLELETPVAFGVLTCDNTEQALARAGIESGNKGQDAALTALEMVDLFSALG